MNHTLEQWMQDVGGLLRRVRTYDRRRMYREEIAEMDEAFAKLSRTYINKEEELSDRQTLEQLAAMKVRLLTMFEDLLFIA